MNSPPVDTIATLRADARAAWQAGLAAVDPEACVARALAVRRDLLETPDSTLIVAVGKAAAGMLRGALQSFARKNGGAPRAIVLLPGHADPGSLPLSVLVLRGGHPHPTREGMEATRRVLREVDALGPGSRLLVLLSGGASALLEAPLEGIAEDELARAHRTLVASGLAIASINLVRGCLSLVKAGRLAERARPAVVTTLAISDVDGDDPAVIGSGPTFPPAISRTEACREALALLRGTSIDLPASARRVLGAGADGVSVADAAAAAPGVSGSGVATTTGSAAAAPGAATAAAVDYTVVASIADAVAAATAAVEARGYRVAAAASGPSAYLRGDTATAAAAIASVLQRPAGRAVREARVFGGETTVAVTAARPGVGGRNLDLACRVAIAIEGQGDVAVAAAGTDGADGSSRAAGAIVDGGSAGRARVAGFPFEEALAAFDTEAAVDSAGDLLVTGPTGTNVGDLVVALMGAR